MSFLKQKMEKRIRRKRKCPRPNPLFEKWLTEWRDDAAEKGLKTKFIFSKALKSLRKYPLPLASGKEAKILEFFGDKICSMLDERLHCHQKRSSNDFAASQKSSSSESPTFSFTQLTSRSSSSSSVGKLPLVAMEMQTEPTSSRLFTEAFQHVISENLPEVSPILAPSSVNSFSLVPGCFSVILCVDNCETFSGHGKNKQDLLLNLKKQGINFEIRKLHVGDFLWIARENKNPNDLSAPPHELVLDFVIERKRMDDLSHSIKDGRFREQKFRMRNCGLRRPIYMVEDHKSVQHCGLPEATLEQAIVNTQVVDGFLIKRTRNTKESVEYLVAMTRYIQNTYENIALKSGSREEVQSSNTPFNVFMEFQEFNSTSVKNKCLKVSEMFAKHLLQLFGLSVDRAATIVENFKTPFILFEAYNMCLSEEEKIKMLSTMKYGKHQRNLGQAISKALHQLYCTNGPLP